MNAQLLQTIQNLPKDTIRSLDKFMHSPYHVTHAGVIRLFELLKERQFAPGTDKDWVIGQLFPGNPDGKRKLYHLTNYLQEALEDFLASELQRSRVHDTRLAAVTAYRLLHLDEQAHAMIRYTRRAMKSGTERGTDYMRLDFQLHLEAYYLSLHQGRDKTFNVQEIVHAQDIAFICEKLRTGCLLLSHRAVSVTEYDNGLLQGVLDFLKDHRYLDIPVVAAYYHGFFAQSGIEGDGHFQQLKQLLEQHAGQFSQPEVHDLYLMAINFCIRRINKAEEPYVREVFDLYKSGLKHGALLENGLMSRWTYNNITATGLRLREYEWLEKFLRDTVSLLPESHREGTFHFNIARYYYETGRHREAMQHLLKMEYDDVLQNLVGKVLLAKIYFELDETNALENQLDTIQIYLRRKKVLGYHKANYAAIVRFMRKLLALNVFDPGSKAGLKSEIERAPTLTEREWFLKQLE